MVYDFIENLFGLKTITKENINNISTKYLLEKFLNMINNDKKLMSKIIQN